MGRPKLLLPWHGQTVIGQVAATVAAAGLGEIVVVTGAQAAEVAQALAGVPVRCVHNPAFGNGEMIDSIRAGLAALDTTGSPAALLCLGDQPQMQLETVTAVLAAGEAGGWARVVLPSYQTRGGHPILLPRGIWPAVLAATGDLRAVLRDQRAAGRIDYVDVDTPTIFADLDTPEDYARAVTS